MRRLEDFTFYFETYRDLASGPPNSWNNARSVARGSTAMAPAGAAARSTEASAASLGGRGAGRGRHASPRRRGPRRGHPRNPSRKQVADNARSLAWILALAGERDANDAQGNAGPIDRAA